MAEVARITFTTATNEDFTEAFVVRDANGAAFDLTGSAVTFRAVGHGGTQEIVASTANGRAALDAAVLGGFAILVPRSVVSALRPGVYEHDLVLTLDDGTNIRVWSGALNLVKGMAA